MVFQTKDDRRDWQCADSCQDAMKELERNTAAELLARVEGHLTRFCELLSYYLCHCKSTWLFSETAQVVVMHRSHLSALQRRGYVDMTKRSHHRGTLLAMIKRGEQVTEEDLQAWILDTDHGLLHGFCVAAMGLGVKYGWNIPDEAFEEARQGRGNSNDVSIVAGSLFHDFLKCNDHGDKEHDRDLRSLFPALPSKTFTHTDPLDKRHPLVAGDRLELWRYEDQSWIRPKMLEEYFEGEDQSRAAVRFFYQYVRPALELLFRNRYAIWARHGKEHAGDKGWTPDTLFPRKMWGTECDEGWTGYPIEIGELPFRGCMNHGPWDPMGLLPLHDFCRLSGHDLGLAGGRDHAFGHGRIPLSEWIFTMMPESRNVNGLDWDLLQHAKGFIPLVLLNQIMETTDRLIMWMKVLKTRGCYEQQPGVECTARETVAG